MSFRTRLSLWYGALLAIVLLITITAAYFAHADTHIADVDQFLAAVSAAQLDGIAADLAGGGVPDLATRVRSEARHELSIAVFAASGGLIAASGDSSLAQLTPLWLTQSGVFETVPLGNERVRVLVATTADPAYRIVFAYSLAELDASLAALRGELLLVLAAALALGVVVAWVLGQAALRPIAALTATASAIAASGRLNERVRGPGRDDELGELARTFNIMLDTVEDAFAKQQQFVGDASHELRTPLTVVRANVELLGRERDVAERARLLAKVSAEVERLCRLVDELLLLSRGDADRAPLRDEPVQLDEIVMDAFDELRTRGGDRLRVVALESALVRGDADRLKQLALILLDNALRYTPPPRGVSLRVSVRGMEAVLAVDDEGIGVRADEVPRVFDRFYRGERARRLDPSGSGLGLAIARWIAVRHGGSIDIAPRSGGGTSAIVRLPLAPSPSGQFRFSRTENASSALT